MGAEDSALAIGRLEEAALRLVFGGPVSLWVPLARLVGVRVAPAAELDDRALASAEAGATEAARRFGPGLAATTLSLIAMLVLLPVESQVMEPYTYRGFEIIAHGVLDGGTPFWLAMIVASASVMLVGVVTGLLNAVVFGGVPLWLLRRCAVAAAPAVSVALAQGDEAISGPQALQYPRVAYAAERILYPRGR